MGRSIKTKYVWVASVILLSSVCAYSYPPDNAAVLYYKAAVLYEADDKMDDMVADVQQGTIAPDDKIREFVDKNRSIINTVLDATNVKNCDWGTDFSQGLATELPPLGSMRKLARLVLADAKILAAEGDYEAAIDHCMSMYRMARHVNDRTLISYLVGISIDGLTGKCLTDIMGQMPQDVENLAWLKGQLTEIDALPLSVKPALLGEREVMLGAMTLEQIPEVVRLCAEDNESLKQKLLSLDAAAIERNRQYYENHFASIITAFDLPYPEGYAQITEGHQKMKEDVATDSELILTDALEPAMNNAFSLSVRFQTSKNVIRSAIELYLIKARTGRLPAALPANLPKDLFSGKDFEYKETFDGFVLRCQGKDLGKDETYEYEFKVKK